MAEEIGGDVSWATWASNRFRLGDKPTVIEAALSEAVDSQVIDLSYVGKIAARMSREGIGKPKGYGGKGKTSKPEPMTNGSGVFLMPRIYPDDKPIPADEAYRIMTGRQKGANA
jgi:hypothetical protein